MSNKLREAITIRKCDNLNKENFFDIATEICPLTMKLFCEWVDHWKYHNNWDGLFQPVVPATPNINAIGRKFHDIPLALQVGVIFMFFSEHGITEFGNSNTDYFDAAHWVDIICYQFEYSEHCLTIRQTGTIKGVIGPNFEMKIRPIS